ncbi:hypothetical protein [Hymenobacter koreensis]|uniref:DUF3311 domain-containing protein n=1 Tax=Hymenobacter koreensis TaxID=1084523 RepID=A0ABP8JKY1_9BACT
MKALGYGLLRAVGIALFIVLAFVWIYFLLGGAILTFVAFYTGHYWYGALFTVLTIFAWGIACMDSDNDSYHD